MFSAGFQPNFFNVACILPRARSASASSQLHSGSVKMLLLSHSHATNMHLCPSADVNGNQPVRSEQIAFFLSAKQMSANALFAFRIIFVGNGLSVDASWGL